MRYHLVAHNLTKRYRGRVIVNQVSLEIQSGEVVGILGPNGAGKTTSFYMLVGLVKCDAGAIYLDNQAITQYPIHKRAQLGLGYLPQEASIFRKLTAAENIWAVLEVRSDLSAADKKKRLQQLLEEFHILHVKDTLALQLSGGERRRVEIARALAMEPKFILLDEPFAGVDPISIIDIKRIITHLRERNIGVLITDHNVRETLSICNRAYIINEGQIIEQGSPRHILDNSKVREVYLGEEFAL